MVFIFSRNMIFFGRKMKEDDFYQKTRGNMVFSVYMRRSTSTALGPQQRKKKKKKDTLSRKNTPKGDISGITGKDDIHPRNYCSHRRCSKRKGVLRNFTKFTGKDLFFNKATGLRPATLLGLQLY